jgi:hypothetical protein
LGNEHQYSNNWLKCTKSCFPHNCWIQNLSDNYSLAKPNIWTFISKSKCKKRSNYSLTKPNILVSKSTFQRRLDYNLAKLNFLALVSKFKCRNRSNCSLVDPTF